MMQNVSIGDLVKLSTFVDDDEPTGLVTRIDNKTLPHLLTILIGDQEIITTEDEVYKI